MIALPSVEFDAVEDVLEDVFQGEIIIIVDSEDRENEGDFFCAAEKVTPEKINLMLSKKGLLCVPLMPERCTELELVPMVDQTASLMGCTFTVSVDVRGFGVTTGVSASDRSKTIEALVDPSMRPDDFARPGHIFPLIAREGGVFERRGHTEAAVDLARLAGLTPAGAIVEILNNDGSMARRHDLISIADELQFKIVSVTDIVKYRQSIKDYAALSSFTPLRRVGVRH